MRISDMQPSRYALSLVSCLGLLLLLAGCRPRSLRPADLLFHVACEGNAITDVTPGMIDHVAIVLSADSVVEAVPDGGVRVTSVADLLRQDGRYLQARVEGVDAERTLAGALRYLGQSYDSLYLPDNAEIYCSELVQFSFVDRQGNRLFQPIPMSFRDSTGEITPYWTDFYRRNDMAVPDSLPGTNPSELSQRRIVRILGDAEVSLSD